MDKWFYYDVLHRRHVFCNPVSDEGIAELEQVLDLKSGMRVLDIACGHGELLLRLAEHSGIRGVGVDASPYAHARAVANREQRGLQLDVEFIHGLAEAYEPDGSFDLVSCIGASWIWAGWQGTLEALVAMTKPGGLVLTGEPYWIVEPADEYLRLEKLRRDEFPRIEAYSQGARDMGLSLVWMRRATGAEWDRYEMLQSASFDAFLREHPDHPDLHEIRGQLIPGKEAYIRWGKDCCGFALWVWRKPAA